MNGSDVLVFIPGNQLNGAQDGSRVSFILHERNDGKFSGTVLRVLDDQMYEYFLLFRVLTSCTAKLLRALIQRYNPRMATSNNYAKHVDPTRQSMNLQWCSLSVACHYQ